MATKLDRFARNSCTFAAFALVVGEQALADRFLQSAEAALQLAHEGAVDDGDAMGERRS